MIIDQIINNDHRLIVIFNNLKFTSTKIKRTKKITFLIKVYLIKKKLK